MIKRLLDIAISLIGLICFFPILLFVSILVWSNDKKSPFYIPPRVGKKGTIFYMVKLRSMVVNADKAGIDSTSNNDLRITPIGQIIRRYKLDELTQLWNVLRGDMSLVCPRPNVKAEVDLYTSVEKELLSVKPGITDFSCSECVCNSTSEFSDNAAVISWCCVAYPFISMVFRLGASTHGMASDGVNVFQ